MKSKIIKIKDLKIGQKIKTKTETGEIVFKTVTDKFITNVPLTDQRKIVFQNGEVLKCSNNHPIMVMEGFNFIEVLPDNLTPQMKVVTVKGVTSVIEVLKEYTDTEDFLDITVEDTHTFFASDDSNMEDAVLTHNSQGGVRGGAATTYFPMWHIEIEDILSWKNNRGTEESRERRSDYGIQIGDHLIKRLLNGQDIYLFDPHEDLYESYFKSEEAFKERYEHYITAYHAGLVRGKIVKSVNLFTHFIDARFETGRYYPMFVNTVNDLSTFGPEYPIYISNLCLEITLPTKPAESENDPNGLISLCTLMSVNMSKFLTIEDMRTKLPKTIEIAIRTLDKLLSYQDYMSPHAKRATDLFRTLGIGVVNLADFLAQNRCRYGTQKALDLVNEFWAAMYYHGKKTSIELAKEFGPCEASDKLQPFNHLKHDALFNLPKQLNLSPTKIEYDFEDLYNEFKTHGIRNATLFAVAPTETSSQLLNATNGIEMPRSVITIKGSKDSVGSAQVIPSPHLADEYDYLWDQKDPVDYIKTASVIGRWCDQSISTNTPYNPAHFVDGKIPRAKLLDDLLLGWKLGLKTFYYNVVNDNATDKRQPIVAIESESDPCGGGACII